MIKKSLCVALSGLILSAAAVATPLELETQGSFAIGGSVVQKPGTFSEDHFLSPEGQKAYGDNAYVFYQIPVNPNKYPIVFQHGGDQTKRTWESTPDGRDGFQNIFLKKHYSVYLIDQPRMGEAGLSTVEDNGNNTWSGNPLYQDQTFFRLSRVGDKNGVFKNSQFPNTPEAVEAFQRSWNPYSGPLDNNVNAKSLAKLFDKIGPSILMTHSMGGTIGWRTPFYTKNVKAIVALEPGGTPFLFPEGQVPTQEKTKVAILGGAAEGVSLQNFKKLTEIPILLIYGDYIPDQPSEAAGPDKWRSELAMARKFVKAVNDHGGHAELIHLPEIGIHGNSHFLMAEKNNQQLAQLIENWLKKNNLAGK